MLLSDVKNSKRNNDLSKAFRYKKSILKQFLMGNLSQLLRKMLI